ncbi:MULTISPECIES: STAS domain-containing protein [Streptomyces]|uniref:STAS domain-containing protein n=1 Tax=Streptomyces TaxID=1883 RepID=UPI000F6DE8C7|nr:MULTISPECIES: STAS domain-containing protein [unclassified Streptomyces]AZM92738.1 anti-sigma factor antagonist [Streptomyces sp. W1SF4]RSS48706.1 anti-sigma factor antagonist [Streptomyces sp. WAC07061]
MTGEQVVVTSTAEGNVTVIGLHGEVDEDNAPLLARALAQAAEGGPRTVVDLSGADFVDSSVLHALLRAQRAHTAAGGALVLAGPFHTGVRRLFEVTGADTVFRMADSLASAMTC